MESAKLFVRHGRSSKISVRCPLLEELLQSVRKKEIVDGAIKPLVRTLGSTLFLYYDRRSLLLVHDIISSLCESYAEQAIVELPAVLMEVAVIIKDTSSPSMSKSTLTALSWSCLALRFSSPSIVTSSLIKSQSILYAHLVQSNKRRLLKKSVKEVTLLWSQQEELVSATLDAILQTTPSPYYLPILNLLAKYYREHEKLADVWTKKRGEVLTYYSKGVLNSRNKPPKLIVAKLSDLFHGVTHSEFSSNLLSPVTKCLLRNPDELIDAVAYLISYLHLDCSRYAMEFTKSASGLLCSSCDSTRDAAVSIFDNLSRQCSDPDVCVTMCQYLIEILLGKGVSGKVSVVEHRMSVLNAISKLSGCSLTTRGIDQLAITTVEGLLGYLKIEAHVGTQVTIINSMVSYCTLFSSVIPKSLLTHLKSALESKTTPPRLRLEYWHCIDQLCKGENTDILKSYLTLATQCVEKCKPSGAQAYLLEEGLLISWILLSRADSSPDSVGAVVTKLWSIIDSGIFASEKITSSVNQTTLVSLIQFTEKITMMSHKLSNPKVWLAAIVHLVVTHPWSLQQHALKCIEHAVTTDPSWSFLILEELYHIMDHILHLTDEEHRDDRVYKSVIKILFVISSPDIGERREEFAIESFILCHHSQLVNLCRGGPWGHHLKLMSLPPSVMISHFPVLVNRVMENIHTKPEACQNGVVTLVKVGGRDGMRMIFEKVVSVLNKEEVLQTTAEDIDISLTPPDQLWNFELRQLLSESLSNKAAVNMKRETKTYSYEDQIWEAKIKEELAKKKQQERQDEDIKTLLQQAKLTQKQRVSIEDQLAYEETVRLKVKKLEKELTAILFLLNVAINCRDVVLPHLPKLVDPVLNSVKSILGKEYCVEMWESICKAALQDRKTGLLLCWTTLKRISPLVRIPPYWSNLPSSSTMNLFASLPVTKGVNGDVLCSITLPLMRCVFRDQSDSGENVGVALQTLSSFCKTHISIPEFGHSLFPVAEMFNLQGVIISSQTTPLRTMKAKKLSVDGYMSLVNSLTDMDQIPPDIVGQLVNSLSNKDALLRQTGLRGIEVLGERVLLPQPGVMAALLVTCNDTNSENNILAKRLWQSAGYSVGALELRNELFFLLTDPPNEYETLLSSTANSLGNWLEQNPDEAVNIKDELHEAYERKRKIPPPSTDKFGRTVSTEYRDPWEGRVGVAKGFGQLPLYLTSEHCLSLLKQIIPKGLSDRNVDVKNAMTDAAQGGITQHGEKLSGQLMSHFDSCLSNLGNSQDDDVVRQAIVVLMGSLAKHMDKDDPKVKSVIEMLLTNLDTPSQQVQQSIATCLIPLASSVKSNAETVINRLMNKLLESSVYSERRGAAYGLAGLVKGFGIPSLKQYEIMSKLQESIKDKKNYRHREGALFAFESLCDMLGKLFEPYVVHLLPDLLLCFGDGNQYVREATDQAAKTIMAHLSSHGVKLILPALLSALEQDNWRTKAGSAELLGAMAYCAPRQLSSCLPSIVPRIMEVLTDSHSKVQQSGNQALRQIGSVIKNPEIQQLVPLLLDALGNPSVKTQACLQALLNTEFEHRIDPPSLALVIPIIKRALDLRSAESKKMAAMIIANMYTVTDRKDLSPYLGEVLPGLKQSITDPLPEVRTSCAKALGAMVQGVGEDELSKVLPWLLQTLQSESTPVDRSGAAQGISEVLKAQDIKHLQQLMPRFIDSAQDMNRPAHCRDGYLMLFIYLPNTFQDQFLQFVDQILPCILKGLADESEYIRDTSILAAQTLINNYADKSLNLFLPQLEKGLLDDNWRIRCSSVQLLGDLLFCISGQSGKMTTESEEDDNFASEEMYQAIVQALGIERRNKMLAGLYMGRSDVALLVRQNSLHVWKLVVTNTARTLKEILPTLITMLLGCLACNSYDKRQVAASTLGDLVRKLGERILPEIFPMLEKGLKSDLTQERQGVCIGLSEIIRETSRDYMQLYANSLFPTIRLALCDKEQEVRAAAAQTFDSLYTAVGQRVLEEILTPLVERLQGGKNEEEREMVLDGLQQIMAVKSNAVLPMIIPRLVQPPANTRALALFSSVAGPALYRYLPRIMPALVTSINQHKGNQDTLEEAVSVVLSIQEEPGLSVLVEELFKVGRHTSDSRRHAAMLLLEALCSRCHANLNEHVAQLIIFTTESLADKSQEVCESGWTALEALVTKVIGTKELPQYIGYLHKALKTCRQALEENGEDEELHGFALKGITPVLTVLKEGLLSGSQDDKEEGARALILVIRLSSAKTLTSGRVVMTIAGPLIRVLGDRYGWNVKVAVLEALVALVKKVGIAAKGFIPQLQTSYLKALGDPNLPVRNQAVIGITELVLLSPRVDPVFNDLHNNIKKNEDSVMRNTLLQALSGVLKSAGERMSDKYKGDLQDTLVALQHTAHEGNRLEAAKCLGTLCTCLSDDQLVSLFETNLLDTSSTSDWGVLQAKSRALLSALNCESEHISSVGLQDHVERAIAAFVSSDRIPVCVNGLECVSEFINQYNCIPSSLIAVIVESFSHTSVDVRQAVCECCNRVSKPTDIFLKAVIPLLLSCSQDKNTAIKAAAEKCLMDRFESGMKEYMSIFDAATTRRLEECFARLRTRKTKNI